MGKVSMVHHSRRITTKEYNRVQEKESSLYEVHRDSEGDIFVALKNETTECVVKNYANISVSLTSIGKKYVNDLMELAKRDDISFNFRPRIGYREWISLSKFDVTEKINLEDVTYIMKGTKPIISAQIDIYYEIEL